MTHYNDANNRLNRKRKSSPLKEKVHFSLYDNTIYLHTTSASSMTELERSKIWYRPQEIDYFRNDYRQYIISSTINTEEPCYVEKDFINKKDGSSESINNNMVNINSMNMLIYRKRRKIIAIRAVLEAQKRIMKCLAVDLDKDNKLAYVSDQFSHWSRILARHVALNTYYSAVLDDYDGVSE